MSSDKTRKGSNGNEKWINPCGHLTSPTAFEDKFYPVSVDEIIKRVLLAINDGSSQLQKFLNNYGDRIYHKDAAALEEEWKDHRAYWLPSKREIPDTYWDPVPEGFMSKMNLQSALKDNFHYLQMFAAGIEQIIGDRKAYGGDFQHEIMETEKSLMGILCEFQTALIHLDISKVDDVNRSIMPENERVFGRDPDRRNLRDYFILRDYGNLLEFIRQLFEYLKKTILPNLEESKPRQFNPGGAEKWKSPCSFRENMTEPLPDDKYTVENWMEKLIEMIDAVMPDASGIVLEYARKTYESDMSDLNKWDELLYDWMPTRSEVPNTAMGAVPIESLASLDTYFKALNACKIHLQRFSIAIEQCLTEQQALKEGWYYDFSVIEMSILKLLCVIEKIMFTLDLNQDFHIDREIIPDDVRNLPTVKSRRFRDFVILREYANTLEFMKQVIVYVRSKSPPLKKVPDRR